jgi:hypothetical protein
MNRTEWQARLEQEEVARGYQDGFKLLFCPWQLLESADTVFLSLNPGNDPSGEAMRIASDERGNSYLIERRARHSPIADQYQKLCKLFGLDTEQVLTGALMPFRTPSWNDRRDGPALTLTRPFWHQVLSRGRVRTVFCVGRTVEREVVAMTGGRQSQELPSGWGKIMIRQYATSNGVSLYGLPHLSKFKLLSRAACISPLEELFGLRNAA